MTANRASRSRGFNPRTREGCDLQGSRCTHVLQCFNPRTREGCDRSALNIFTTQVCFNPRTREGCDSEASIQRMPPYGFQSTHPRGVRPAINQANYEHQKVSIHAPARGATMENSHYEGIFDVSIHAPARGATSHAGHIMLVRDPVSIHAPARGATWSRQNDDVDRGCFNPRTREGCDQDITDKSRLLACFNPRTREGCDQKPSAHEYGEGRVSIHAPARGATSFPAWITPDWCVSIHAPVRGAT